MDELAGEQLHHLAEHVLEELHRGIGGVEDVAEDAPVGGHRGGVACQAQFGIGRNGRHGVARHLDLRHHVDVAVRRVGHDLPDVVLAVEPAGGRAVELHLGAVFRIGRNHRFLPPRADLGELRVLLYLYPPALVIGEMPVEGVHLVKRQQVDVLLDEFLGHEMPHHIQVRAPPPEARLVLDRHRRHAPLGALHRRIAEDVGWQELADGLDAVEEPRRFGRAHRHAMAGNRELVAFSSQGVQAGVTNEHQLRARRRPAHPNRQPPSHRRLQIIRQLITNVPTRMQHPYPGFLTDMERAGPHRNMGWAGNDGDRALGSEGNGQRHGNGNYCQITS